MRDFMRLGSTLLVAALIAVFSSIAASAAAPTPGKRVALVIGNANYQNTVALPNTANDAGAMAGALQRLDFDVVTGVDLTRDQMNRTMKTFARKLVGAEVGLFYYAGHGMQVAGENYLIPVDAALAQETDLDFEGVKIKVVMDRLLASAKVKIVILDSCRDNPLAASLARSMGSSVSRSMAPSAGLSAMSGASGTLVAFATAPGKIALDGNGKNSPFTSALLKHIETPGLDVDVMMKRVRGEVARSTGARQQPWTNSALNGEFYLKPALAKPVRISSLTPTVPVTTAPPAAVLPAPSSQPRGLSADTRAQLDLAAWTAAHRNGAGSKSDYKNYLSSHPAGHFAGLARAQIQRIERQPVALAPRSTTVVAAATPVAPSSSYSPTPAVNSATTAEMERVLAISKSDWYQIQRKLTDLGYWTRGVDGNPGRGTRSAISKWQASKGYPSTGYLGNAQQVALMSEVVTAAAKAKSRTYKRSRTTRRSKRRQSSSDNSNALGAVIGAGIAIGVACKLSGRC